MGWRAYLQEAPAPAEERAETADRASGTPDTFRGAVEIVTPEGERVWVVTEREALRLIPPGVVFFTPHEVEQLRQAGKEAVRVAVMVKQVFTGAVVAAGGGNAGTS